MKSELNITRLVGQASESSQISSKQASIEKNTHCNIAEAGNNAKKSSVNTLKSGKSFKKVINDVAKANKQAQKSDVQTHSADSDCASADTTDTCKNKESEKSSLSLQLSLSDCQEEPSGDVDNESTLSNSKIIADALSNISQLLNLNGNQETITLQMDNLSDAAKEQLAEIIYSLKGISSVLNEAIQSNQAVVINGVTLDPAQAASIEKLLRVETFHIEVALENAGVSADIADILAQKSNLPSTNNGIVTATEPSLISMPASQIKQVLENTDADTTGETVDSLFQKLAASLRDTNTASGKTSVAADTDAAAALVTKTVTDSKLQNIQVVSVNGNKLDPAGAEENKQKSDTGVFDSKVMRTILKIDNTEAENQDAAKGMGKLGLLESAKTLIAENINASTQNNDTSNAASLVNSGNIDNNNTASLLPDIKTVTTGKLIEDSVLNQVTEKLHTALKSGVNEIRLLLRPESLGEMRIKLTVDGDIVMGKIYVENQQVKHILESNMQTLKDSLAQHNLQVTTLDVNVGGDSWNNMNDMPQPTSSGLKNEANNKDVSEEADNISDVVAGMDTGRRFGSNTFEFFA